MHPLWFIRIPFALTFAGHGTGKLLMPAASAQMLDLPVSLTVLVGIAEVLAGIGAFVGGIERAPQRTLIDRLTEQCHVINMKGCVSLRTKLPE